MSDLTDVVRRLLATDNECRAAIWLQNETTEEWYEWDVCNMEPGHDGPHQVWSDRDSDYWATWTDSSPAISKQVNLGSDQRLTPAPWSSEELTMLAKVREEAKNQ